MMENGVPGFPDGKSSSVGAGNEPRTGELRQVVDLLELSIDYHIRCAATVQQKIVVNQKNRQTGRAGSAKDQKCRFPAFFQIQKMFLKFSGLEYRRSSPLHGQSLCVSNYSFTAGTNPGCCR